VQRWGSHEFFLIVTLVVVVIGFQVWLREVWRVLHELWEIELGLSIGEYCGLCFLSVKI